MGERRSRGRAVRRARRTAGIGVACAGIVAAVAAGGAGASTADATQPGAPGQQRVSLGPTRTIVRPASGNAAFPTVFDASTTRADGTRQQRLLASYGTGRDAPGENGAALVESTDGGASWRSVPLPAPSASMNDAVRLADAAGTVLSVDFEPTAVSLQAADPVPSTPQNEAETRFRRWTLTGTTWAEQPQAQVRLTSVTPDWLRMHKGILLLADTTTLLATVYGKAGSEDFAAVIRSTDNGATWTEVTMISRQPGVSETNLAPTSDGRIMAWTRRSPSGDVLPDLLYSVSATADGGGPWSAPVVMSSDTGNSPGSLLLGNGSALQASGRPGNILRHKFDGTSGWQGWTGRTDVYNNAPTSGPGVLGRLGSSNTLALAPLSANTALLVGDNCAGNWGCPASASGYPHGTAQFLWARTAQVSTGQWGTLDLATKLRRGEVSFPQTSFVAYGAASGRRQSLGAYAFDGDVRNDSSVVTADRRLTLKLDRAYDLTGIGAIAALRGAADLTIETSMDGTTWTTPGRGPRAGAVRPFSAPVRAQYVRVADPNTGSATTQAFLNELQVFTLSDGFEDDVPGSAPAGNGVQPATTQNAVVVDSATVAAWVDPISSRLLKLEDTSTTSMARIRWLQGSAARAEVGFLARSSGTPTKTLLVTLSGTDGSTPVDAYHLRIDAATGDVYRYDAARASWGSPVGRLPGNVWSWHRYAITATTTSATISQDGVPVATVTPTRKVTALTGLGFSSSGTAPTGDTWFFDDVSYARP